MERKRWSELDGLPVLAAGAHADPSMGGCFMEYASLLAGERWSDHPRCTHPALAQLARVINDASPAEIRQRLAPLVPDVVGVAGKDATVTPLLVLRCVERLPSDDLRRRRAERTAQRRLHAAARGGLAARRYRFTEPAYRNGAALHAMGATVHELARTEPDELPGLLTTAIATARDRLSAPVAAVRSATEPVEQ